MEAFQVYTRIRPLNNKEIQTCGDKVAVRVMDDGLITVGESQYKQTSFQVDKVFDQFVQNQQIFEMSVKPVLDNFLSGVNSTIFAYGITGAGKSHTMFGSSDGISQAGLIDHSLAYICNTANDLPSSKITMSYMEIYNQQVFDLLRHKSQNLMIQDDPIQGVVVSDLEQVEIHSARSARALIEVGNTRRVVAETKANQFSSRSHAIVQITVERKMGDVIVMGKLSLVDLAGSQRQSVYSQQKGIRNLQGSNINRSLLTLGNCITMLSDKRRGGFVPYRDSKLTRLLKDSLGGNTKTIMIACISPSMISYDETLNTMKYACRARKIEKVVHQNVKEGRSQEQLRKEIARLKKQLDLKGRDGPGIRRSQMQQFVQKIIKNVESLTKIRCQAESDLPSKLRQIELIEQQSKMVNSILQKCVEQQPQQKPVIVRSNTIDVMDKRKKKRSAPTHRMEIEQIMKISPSMVHIAEAKMQEESSFVKPSSSKSQYGSRSNLFMKGNLQNARVKHLKEKKVIKELISSYVQNWQSPEDRMMVIQKVQEIVNSDHGTLLLAANDKLIINKIIKGEKIFKDQIDSYCFSTRIIPDENNMVDNASLKLKEPSSRFIQSLCKIKSMMRRVSGTNSMVSQQAQFIQFNSRDNTIEEQPQLFVQ